MGGSQGYLPLIFNFYFFVGLFLNTLIEKNLDDISKIQNLKYSIVIFLELFKLFYVVLVSPGDLLLESPQPTIEQQQQALVYPVN